MHAPKALDGTKNSVGDLLVYPEMDDENVHKRATCAREDRPSPSGIASGCMLD